MTKNVQCWVEELLNSMKVFTLPNLKPELSLYLKSTDESLFFHDAHKLKHPLAIYNIALRKVEDSLSDFVEVYDAFTLSDLKESKKEMHIKLMKSYKNFLYSLREYLDDCISIIKTFIKPEPGFKEDRNQYLWLQKNAPKLVGSFFEGIKEYKKYLNNIINELKHNNGILNPIGFYDDASGEFLIGYFVANVSNGIYEPVEKIHERFSGLRTAFSFARDIRYNVCNIFFIAKQVVDVLRKLNFPEPSVPDRFEAVPKEGVLYQWVSSLPRMFFPDEYLKEVPSVAIVKDGSLKLESASALSIKKNSLPQLICFHSGDGHTKAFGMPYFQ